MLAAANGVTDVAETLLNGGADPQLKDKVMKSRSFLCDLLFLCVYCSQKGDTALICASYEGHPKLVQALLRHHADVDAVNNGGESALIRAASRGNLLVVKELLAHGADVNARDKVN